MPQQVGDVLQRCAPCSCTPGHSTCGSWMYPASVNKGRPSFSPGALRVLLVPAHLFRRSGSGCFPTSRLARSLP